MLGRLGFNALAAVTLAATAVLGAYLPVLLSSRDKLRGGTGRSLTYVLGNMLSAGVMVSAGFCHLLGEALKQMPDMVFPLAPFLCGVGFLLTLICDAAAERAAEASPSAQLLHCHGPANGHDSEPESDHAAALVQAPNGSRSLQRRTPDKSEFDAVQEVELGNVERERGAIPAPQEGAPLLPSPAHESVRPHTPPQSIPTVSYVTALLLGVALCFHSILEGAAMGAQETVAASMHIFIAIVSHKGLAAYALGSSIVDSGASTQKFWAVVAPFTLASPFGIFIGYIVSDLAAGTGAASISALASGTFLYVAFMEVIPKELHVPGHIVAKLLMLLLGYALMSILAIWA